MGNFVTKINSNTTLNNNIQKTNTNKKIEKKEKIVKIEKTEKTKKIEKTKFIVSVPENVKSGETFLVRTNNSTLSIKCPDNVGPNHKLKFYVPKKQTDTENDNNDSNDNKSFLSVGTKKNKTNSKKYNSDYKLYYITIPEGIKPRDNLLINVEGKKITIGCPNYNYPNERVCIKILKSELDKYTINNDNSIQNVSNTIKFKYNDEWFRYICDDYYFYWEYEKNDNKSSKKTNLSSKYNILANSYVSFIKKSDNYSNYNIEFNIELCDYYKYHTKNNLSNEIIKLSQTTFQLKSKWIRNELNKTKIPWEEGHVKIKVRRSNLLEDGIKVFNSICAADLKKTFRFEFMGEPALDSNGVAKEFYDLMSKEIVKPEYQLFEVIETIQDSYQINFNSFINDNHIEHFYAYGRIIGKCLLDGYTTPINLCPLIYKHILQYPFNFNDSDIYH